MDREGLTLLHHVLGLDPVSVLRRALNQAVKWGQLDKNACDAVEKPRQPKRKMQALTSSEVALLLEAARGDRYYCLYLLAVTTGLRQGELFALHWENISFERKTLSVTHSLMEVRGKHTRSEPKTKSSQRLVDLPDFVVDALREHQDRFASGDEREQWVFTAPEGGPLRKSNFYRRSFRPLLSRAGLIKKPPVRFHDLRHTAATLLLEQGVHPKVVQERLGHSQISVTMDTYSHVLPSMQRDAAQKLNVLFQGMSTAEKLDR